MKNILLIAILVVVAIFSVSPARGQDDVLVPGNPPLTAADFAAVVEFYERGLAIRFSSSERDELREKFAASWRRGQKSRSADLVGFLNTVKKMNRIDAAKISANQDEFRNALLGDLKNMSNNDWAAYVIGVYENAGGSEENAVPKNDEKNAASEDSNDAETNEKAPEFQPASAVRAADLTGKWVKGTTASYGYRDTVTNDYRSGYGAANQHDVYAGGSFDYTNYAQVSGYGCTTELYTSMKGRYALRGAEVTFSYVSGTVKIEDSCKKSVVTKPAQIKATTYRLERAGDQLRMCEVGAENPTCLYRVKD